MKKRNVRVVLFVLISLCFSIAAKGNLTGTVDIAYSGLEAYSTMNIWGGGHNGDTVSAGAFTVTKSDDTEGGDHWANGKLTVFCVDLPQLTSSNTLTYNVIMPEEGPVTNPLYGSGMGTEKADYLAELWGRFYDNSWSDGDFYSIQERYEAEAFAAAIWEIVFEALPSISGNAWDVRVDGTSGVMGFKATYLDWSLANSWLSQLDGTGPKADLMVFSNSNRQDFLVEAPEPITIALLGLGSLCLIHRKKKQLS